MRVVVKRSSTISIGPCFQVHVFDLMESAMCETDHEVPQIPWTRLTPEQRVRVTRLITAHARAARTQAMRDLLRGLFRLLLRVPFAIATLWRTVALWHTRRRAIRELNAFDDRALHDMGIRRSEIEAAVFGRPR
jgi:uncharacterized protein YjiS (DUF1127 family)